MFGEDPEAGGAGPGSGPASVPAKQPDPSSSGPHLQTPLQLHNR